MKLTSVRRITFVVQVPLTCVADETASFDGIPPVVGAPASLFRLVLSVVYLNLNKQKQQTFQ